MYGSDGACHNAHGVVVGSRQRTGPANGGLGKVCSCQFALSVGYIRLNGDCLEAKGRRENLLDSDIRGVIGSRMTQRFVERNMARLKLCTFRRLRESKVGEMLICSQCERQAIFSING